MCKPNPLVVGLVFSWQPWTTKTLIIPLLLRNESTENGSPIWAMLKENKCSWWPTDCRPIGFSPAAAFASAVADKGRLFSFCLICTDPYSRAFLSCSASLSTSTQRSALICSLVGNQWNYFNQQIPPEINRTMNLMSSVLRHSLTSTPTARRWIDLFPHVN